MTTASNHPTADLASLSGAERMQLAQGLLITEWKSKLLLTAALEGYRAQTIVADMLGEPGNRLGLQTHSSTGDEIIVCIGGWEELGIFTAREAGTAAEKLVMNFDWESVFPANRPTAHVSH